MRGGITPAGGLRATLATKVLVFGVQYFVMLPFSCWHLVEILEDLAPAAPRGGNTITPLFMRELDELLVKK